MFQLTTGILLLLALVGGCSRSKDKTLTLATTTSTQDSGLLDELVPLFEAKYDVKVKVVAVGTGQALQLGRRGDADVLLVHSPELERNFMDDGFGESRTEVMYNDFIVVGPPDDPAGVKGERDVAKAFGRIREAAKPFISRGDESGTHQKEKEIWKQLDVQPKGSWYVSAGSGMGAVLRMADEKRAYTLTDRATFLSQRDKLDLRLMSEGDRLLENRYSVIVVSGKKHEHTNSDAAKLFLKFLQTEEAREMIATFGKDRYGEALFHVIR